VVPLGELENLGGGHLTDPRRFGHGEPARLLHVGLEALHVAVDEAVVESAATLQLGRHRPREDHVGAWLERDVQVSLLGDLGPLGIHHHHLGSVTPGGIDDGGQVEVRPGDVVAPRDDHLGQAHLLGGDARRGAKGSHPCLAPDASAEWRAVEERSAELVEEAQVHGRVGEHAVRTRVVEGQDGLGAVRSHGRGEPIVDDVQRLVPGRAGEAAFALGPHAPQRREEPARAVHPVGVRRGDLGADHPGGVRIRAGAPDPHDPGIFHGDGEAAGVGAIQGTDARVFCCHGAHSKRRPGSAPRPPCEPHALDGPTAPKQYGDKEEPCPRDSPRPRHHV
jgi:hypothetical protein